MNGNENMSHMAAYGREFLSHCDCKLLKERSHYNEIVYCGISGGEAGFY